MPAYKYSSVIYFCNLIVSEVFSVYFIPISLTLSVYENILISFYREQFVCRVCHNQLEMANYLYKFLTDHGVRPNVVTFSSLITSSFVLNH